MATSPSSPIPFEKFTAIYRSTPVVQVVPACFIDGDCVTAFPLHNGFQLLQLVAHAACIIAA